MKVDLVYLALTVCLECIVREKNPLSKKKERKKDKRKGDKGLRYWFKFGCLFFYFVFFLLILVSFLLQNGQKIPTHFYSVIPNNFRCMSNIWEHFCPCVCLILPCIYFCCIIFLGRHENNVCSFQIEFQQQSKDPILTLSSILVNECTWLLLIGAWVKGCIQEHIQLVGTYTAEHSLLLTLTTLNNLYILWNRECCMFVPHENPSPLCENFRVFNFAWMFNG